PAPPRASTRSRTWALLLAGDEGFDERVGLVVSHLHRRVLAEPRCRCLDRASEAAVLGDLGAADHAGGRRTRRPRRARTPAARLPYALRLLEGRGRPVRARLRAQLRPESRGDADELHLRPAADGHRRPGVGRTLPDPR